MSEPEEALRRVGRTHDLPELEGRSVTVGDVEVAIFRTESGFVAVGARCPHRGGPLSDGIVADRCVTCPLHNWRIDLHTGQVTAGGQGHVPVYHVVERKGELYLRVSAVDGSPVALAADALPAAA